MLNYRVVKGLFVITTLLCVVLMIQPVFAADNTVDINHASLEELTSLKHVGETIAKRIIERREEIGGFKTIESLLDVKGFGPRALEDNKDRIVITPIKKKGS
jgi:competence ComEA-like helix-hairpin-helix protein